MATEREDTDAAAAPIICSEDDWLTECDIESAAALDARAEAERVFGRGATAVERTVVPELTTVEMVG